MTQRRKSKRPLATAHKVALGLVVLGGVIAIITAFIANIDKFRPNQNNNLAEAVPTAKTGDLVGDIEAVEVIPYEGGGVQTFIRLSLTNNTNMPTGVHKYAVKIDHATSKSFQYNGPTHAMEEPYALPEAGVIQPQESLITKTQQAISVGRKVTGWLRVALPDPELEPAVVRQVGTRYNVSFTDTTGITGQAKYEVR